MILFKEAADLIKYLRRQKSAGKNTGFVPTMGALHNGHLSLINASKRNTDITVCSIFVNPTQFNDPKDFLKYPVTIEKDIRLLEANGTDVLFLPSVETIYPEGTEQMEHYDLGRLETLLEGKSRPGHFQGVCQVMSRILRIVQPDHLFMGQKDYQQCMVIKKLLALVHSATVLHTCDTVRDADGLAMSSRNLRLNKKEREKATGIYTALMYIRANMLPGALSGLIMQAGNILLQHDFHIDYVEVADATTLEPVQQWDGQQKTVALIAAFQHEVRLIDNMIL